ncbi:hypothetical protein H6P81_016708 [Aristolochia fimbriata]|uniref:Uncharacterized protein n=1 Tax=Aristolochia fimbriata TaxID=158543 RepID=A0AAV7EDP8_ARIFI|nr:hypothetical protein H6P81_016708 [Aristolochia fimbriata]
MKEGSREAEVAAAFPVFVSAQEATSFNKSPPFRRSPWMPLAAGGLRLLLRPRARHVTLPTIFKVAGGAFLYTGKHFQWRKRTRSRSVFLIDFGRVVCVRELLWRWREERERRGCAGAAGSAAAAAAADLK